MSDGMSRPDSCNGELPWPRQWGDEHLAPSIEMRRPCAGNHTQGFAVAEQSYVDSEGRRCFALVSARHENDGCITFGVGVGSMVNGRMPRGAAVILRDLLNEVLEATS